MNTIDIKKHHKTRGVGMNMGGKTSKLGEKGGGGGGGKKKKTKIKKK